MVLNTEWAQVEVIDLINDGSGLAFGIIGGRSTGVVVKTILPGGVADRDGRLQSGDHILQIGEVNLRGLGSEQVASVLRQCGVHVRMVVARPVESTNSDYQALGSHAPIVPTKILGDPVELDRHLIENGYVEALSQQPASYSSPYIYTGHHTDVQLHPITNLVDVVKDPLPIGNVPLPIQVPVPPNVNMLPLDMALHEPKLPETETYTVELRKDDLGLGITIAGYVCEKEEISGIFVKSISKGSAADATNKIKINDRIIEVDGNTVIGHTNHQAVEILRNTGPIVKIKLERYLRGPKYEQLQQAIRANELRPPSPPSPSASSLPKIPLSLVRMSYLGIEPEGESRTSFDFDSAILLEGDTPTNEEKEIVIDGRKSVQFSIASHESIHDKWSDEFKDAEIVIAEMHKEPSSGLGISLEGTVDVEDGKEVRPHHYIRNILPDGPVGRNGLLQAGDELLEVNGMQLKGLNHLEVVSILKQLPNFVCLVCARYSIPTRIIDTSQHPEAFQARKILAGSLQTLIPNNNNERLVKAKSETSLASSVSLASDTCNGSRSRSLELIAGLPMWSDQPTEVELIKGDYGLGFSILDYQDPLNPQETVIVIRSLVPGGVAQNDGRLIPGDRLLKVNNINLEHASLDRAVQVLKGAPKGPVLITVAKPITPNDTVSHNSQDTEDDQTCLDSFHECIEEYQECLEVVQICIDEDNSFNHSPCTSQVEDFGQVAESISKEGADFLESTPLKSKLFKHGSDIDVSFKSTNEQTLNDSSDCNSKITSVIKNNNKIHHKNNVLLKNDSLTQSDKVNLTVSSNISEKDGYETCMDESLSEDSKLPKEKNEKSINNETETNNHEVQTTSAPLNLNIENVQENTLTFIEQPLLLDSSQCLTIEKIDDTTKIDFLDQEETTPTNSRTNIAESNPCATEIYNSTLSEPCLVFKQDHSHIYLDSKPDDFGLKSYDNQQDSLEVDEFFIVQFPPDTCQEVTKSYSDPNVLESYETPRKITYRRCLNEYYNDYEDCLEAYKIYTAEKSFCDAFKGEISDDEIFHEILLPFKCKSAPDIMDSTFVTLTYDPGPDSNKIRRKSAFVAGYQGEESDLSTQMTVIRPIDNEYGIQTGSQVSDMLQKHWGSTRTVEVFREPNASLGISIVGGKVDLHASEISETILGIFVKNVVPNSPAGRSGKLKTGDRILNVSGIDLRHASHETAVQAIRNASNPVTFCVQSLIPWSCENEFFVQNDNSCPSPYPSPVSEKSPVKFDETEGQKSSQKIMPSLSNEPPTISNDIIKNEEETQQPSATYSGDESEEDDDEDYRDIEGRTISSKGVQIDRASAANVRRTKEEMHADPQEEDDFGYTMNKVKKKYAHLGHSVTMVQLERSSAGLGLSLAGHKDRNCMAVFVCGLNPTGAAFKAGQIQVGDEILEVNGVVLHGRCHLNASAIIKGLSGPIFKVILLRRKTAIDDIAVKPITQFPVTLAEEASEEQFSASYPNVRTVAIKKGSQSLGIMIIEGKHAEIGQGIFISDIQEGSSAEKAGLEIGEMILAVNKDTLVGANYDTAASLLKRTEGLVTLVVSNPSKKELTPPPIIENNKSSSSTLKPAAPPSRPATPLPEPPIDLTTCQITPGKEVTIEILTDNKGLGIFFVGGKDTLITNGIVVVEVYPGGMADKDGRLQPGDQILDVNGTTLKDVSYTTASQALRQTLPKMKLIIYRPDKIDYTTIETDLIKKPGKGLGLSLISRKCGKGVYVSDIISGGLAELDGRITKGDLLISVNGQNVENMSGEEAGAIIKTIVGRTSLKLHRYKPITR